MKAMRWRARAGRGARVPAGGGPRRAVIGGGRSAAAHACLCARFLALVGSLAVLSFSARVAAQDSATGEPSFKPTPSSAPAAHDTSNQLLGPIERLPASAYPSQPIRGIYGGSMWMTFHGLQWPYYPKTGIGVSGYVWIDTGYERIGRGNPSPADPSTKYFVQQGRLVLRVTPTWSDGQWFVQGQSEFVGNEDQSLSPPDQADIDDLWIKLGRWKAFDVQVGRFEGFEIYHFGMGLDLHTLEREGATDRSSLHFASTYGVTTLMYRQHSLGQAAVHVYPTDWLRFELQGRYGNEGGYNTAGVRPVAVLDFGMIKFKAGAEYQVQNPQPEGSKEVVEDKGAGAAVQFVLEPYVEFGINGAYGWHDHTKQDGAYDNQGSLSTYSIGAFANGRVVENLLVGLGLNYTYLLDKQFDPSAGRYEDFDQWQAFGAVQYLLWKQLFIKGVVGYALADFNPNMGNTTFFNRMISGRLRLQYLF